MTEYIRVKLEKFDGQGGIEWQHTRAHEFAYKDVALGVDGFRVCDGVRDYFFPGTSLDQPLIEIGGKYRIRKFPVCTDGLICYSLEVGRKFLLFSNVSEVSQSR
jgi:hypothetical protein